MACWATKVFFLQTEQSCFVFLTPLIDLATAVLDKRGQHVTMNGHRCSTKRMHGRGFSWDTETTVNDFYKKQPSDVKKRRTCTMPKCWQTACVAKCLLQVTTCTYKSSQLQNSWLVSRMEANWNCFCRNVQHFSNSFHLSVLLDTLHDVFFASWKVGTALGSTLKCCNVWL